MPMALVPRFADAVAGELTDAQCAAVMWLLNAHLYARLLARTDADRVLAMNGEQVIAHPRRTVLAVAEFFGLANADVRAWVEEMRPATTHSHSAGARQSYDAEGRAADLAAAEQRCGEEANTGIAWAHGICPELVSRSPFETGR